MTAVTQLYTRGPFSYFLEGRNWRQEWCQMQTVSLEIGRIGKHGFRCDWLSLCSQKFPF
jgi:hypothetical protein